MTEMNEKFTVVKGYYRKDKTYVGAHIRKLSYSPDSTKESEYGDEK